MFHFPESPIVKPILVATKFPKQAHQLITDWTQMPEPEFRMSVLQFKQSKEFRRMLEMGCGREGVVMSVIETGD